MPDKFASVGVEREQGVGVEVVADAVRAVEVIDRGAGWGEDDASLLVDDHAGPVVCRPGGLPCVFGPGLVTRLAGVGDGMKAPAQLAGAHIVGADIAVRSGMRLRRAEADDDHVFVDRSGRGQYGEVAGEVLIPEILAQVDAAAFAEAGDRLAGRRIERVEMVHHTGEEDALTAVGPVREATAWLRGLYSGIEGSIAPCQSRRPGRGFPRRGCKQRWFVRR